MTELKIYVDEIADKLDELADISEVWKNHRFYNKNPSAVRNAMIMIAQEIVFTVKHEQELMMHANS